MEIWVHRNGQYAGKFSETVIREKIADGSLSGNDLAWDQEKSLWKPLGEFIAALPGAAEKAEGSAPKAESSPAPVEEKPVEIRRVTPPPLPSIAAAAPAAPRAVAPPPLPSMMPSDPAADVAHAPPEGEKIWNPYIAILGSIFLSPAFGGFIIWRNWLRMNRRRRAMVAAPWFWIGFVVIGLLFYSRERIVWIIWAAYLIAWIAFSAYPQIRYVNTTFKRERFRSGLPFAGACLLFLVGSLTYWLTAPKALVTTPTLEPSPQQPVVVQQQQQQLSTSHDRVF